MYYLIISYSHKNTDLATRERLAFDSKRSDNFLHELVMNKFIDEGILLSTCNRVEFILSFQEKQKAGEFLLEKLAEHTQIPREELFERADFYEDSGAIHHLFCVASSLDSLVIGETQIAGQLKSAFKFACDSGYCSQKLSRAMHFAFKCAASVRNCTEISKNPVSVASASVSKAKEILGDLGGDTAVVVGLGEMGQLAIKHLNTLGCNVILVNRDRGKAEEFAREFNGGVSVEGFSRLGELINSYKLLFSATGAPHTVITKDMVAPKNFKRHWFDLAVPRDIESIKDDTINIYAVDDLQDIVKKNISLREEQARRAYGIIGQFTQEFFKWLQSLSLDPIIKAMREQAREASIKELDKAISKGYIPKECEKSLEKILHNAFNTFLHHPTMRLKEISEEPKADTVVEAVKLIFGIENAGKIMLDRYKCEYDTTSSMKEE